MTVFDQFFMSMFSYYKTAYKQKANTIALYYISFLEITIILVLGVFFAAFFSQMKVDAMNSLNAWTLFILAAIVICFKNWIKYSGKKRKVMNAKMIKKTSKQNNIFLLWLLPIACIALSIVLLKAV